MPKYSRQPNAGFLAVCSPSLSSNRPWKSPLQRGFIKLWQFRSWPDQNELPPENPGPQWREPQLARLEAVLFLAREPLTSRKIAQLANLADGTEARTLIRRLKRLYDAGRHAFRVKKSPAVTNCLPARHSSLGCDGCSNPGRKRGFRRRRWKLWRWWRIVSRFCGRKWKRFGACSATISCGNCWIEI